MLQLHQGRQPLHIISIKSNTTIKCNHSSSLMCSIFDERRSMWRLCEAEKRGSPEAEAEAEEGDS